MAKATTVQEIKKPEFMEVKSAYWDKELLIQDTQVGENRVRLSLCTKKEVDWLSIREWYKTVTGEYSPGKHGLAIRLEDPSTLDSLIGALNSLKLYMA